MTSAAPHAPDTQQKIERLTIVYDDECPFCNQYVKLLRLRNNVGQVKLVSARDAESDAVTQLRNTGYVLDKGMAVILDGTTYYASDAIWVLSRLSSRSNVINHLWAALFANRAFVKRIYPVLKLFRHLGLRIKGAKMMGY